MEKIEAWPIAGIEMECPNCGQIIQELGGDPREIEGYYPEAEGILECPHCEEEITYFIPGFL